MARIDENDAHVGRVPLEIRSSTVDWTFFSIWWMVLGVATTVGVNLAPWYDEQRILSLGATAVAVALLVGRRELRVNLGFAAFLLCLFALGIWSSLLSQATFVALIEVGLLVSALVVVCYFSNSFGSHALLLQRELPLAALAVAAVQGTGILSNYVAAVLSADLTYYVWITGFSNPRFPAQMQALLLPFLPAAIAVLPKRFYRVCGWFAGALWVASIIGLGSRGAWFALAGGVAFVVISGADTGRKWITQMALIFIAGCGVFVLLNYGVPFLMATSGLTYTETLRAGLSGREILWAKAIDMIQAKPLLGWGPMYFAAAEHGLPTAHAHNFWFQLAAEWGLPVAVMTAAVALIFLLRLYKCTVRCQSLAEIGACAACAVWFAYALIDGVYQIPTTVMVTLPVLGAGLALQNMLLREQAFHTPASMTVGASIARGVALLSVAPFLLLPFIGLGDRSGREASYVEITSSDRFAPRFWRQGFLYPEDARWKGERTKTSGRI